MMYLHRLQSYAAVSVVTNYTQSIILLLVCRNPDTSPDIFPELGYLISLIGERLQALHLQRVFISSDCVDTLTHMTSPCNSLGTLKLQFCSISSSDYCLLTKTIASSNLKQFVSWRNNIDGSNMDLIAEALGHVLRESKTLNEVAVNEFVINKVEDLHKAMALQTMLFEAKHHGSVKNLQVGMDAPGMCSTYCDD